MELDYRWQFDANYKTASAACRAVRLSQKGFLHSPISRTIIADFRIVHLNQDSVEQGL